MDELARRRQNPILPRCTNCSLTLTKKRRKYHVEELNIESIDLLRGWVKPTVVSNFFILFVYVKCFVLICDVYYEGFLVLEDVVRHRPECHSRAHTLF